MTPIDSGQIPASESRSWFQSSDKCQICFKKASYFCNMNAEKLKTLLFFQNNNPLGARTELNKKKKDCCKNFKKGDRCKKCPGHK